MQIIKAGYEILDPLNGEEILKKIERVARVCYKSEEKIGEGTAEKMVRALVKSKHEAMLEHFSFSVKFIVDRGVSHELVRHRVASFAQESTRYCNYGKSGEVTFIEPTVLRLENKEDKDGYTAWHFWHHSMEVAETAYKNMLGAGATPQELLHRRQGRYFLIALKQRLL